MQVKGHRRKQINFFLKIKLLIGDYFQFQSFSQLSSGQEAWQNARRQVAGEEVKCFISKKTIIRKRERNIGSSLSF